MALIAEVKTAAPSFGCDPDLGQTGTGYAREVPPTFGWDRDSGRYSGRAGWWVRRSEAFAALNVIGGAVGTPETFTIFGTARTRVVPLRHPMSTNLIAHRVAAEFRAVDPDDPEDWLDCLITVDFDQPDYGTSGSNAFVEITADPIAGEVVRPSAYYQAGTAPYDNSPDPAHSMVLTYTLHQMPGFNPALWRANANTTNDATWEGFAAKTLLFIPPRAGMKRSAGGVESWSASLTFKVAPPGQFWGYTYLPDGTYVQRLDSSGDPVVPEISFDSLFVE